jgi:hypothetical protein
LRQNSTFGFPSTQQGSYSLLQVAYLGFTESVFGSLFSTAVYAAYGQYVGRR